MSGNQRKAQHMQDDDIHALPLCADAAYYYGSSRYPRHHLVLLARWLLSHFAFLAAGVAGGIITLVWQVIGDALRSGPSALNPSLLTHYFALKLIRAYPVLAPVLILLVVLLLIGARFAHDDEEKERLVLARRMYGERLAMGYSRYLTEVRAGAGALPPLLQSMQETLDDVTQIQQPMLYAPLRLADDPRELEVHTPLDSHNIEPPTSTGKANPTSRTRRQVAPASLQGTETQRHAIRTVRRVQDALDHSPTGAIVVVGQAGAGKSTVLRHLAWEEATMQLAASAPIGRIPFVLDLSLGLPRDGIRGAVTHHVESLPDIDDEVKTHLIAGILEGPSLLLIDGLDEQFGPARGRILSAINALVPTATEGGSPSGILHPWQPGAQVPRQVVVGSRLTSYRQHRLDRAKFASWELLPMYEATAQRQLVEQVLDVLRQLPGSNEPSPAPVLNPATLVQELSMRAQTRGWASNPLLLTLSTVDWARRGGARLAQTRTSLYRGAIRALLDQRTRSAEWTEDEYENVLALAQLVCLYLFERGRRDLAFQEFKLQIEPTLPPLLARGSWRGHLGPADVLLDKSGLFIREASRLGHESALVRYDVAHLTFLEYLAARELARMLTTQWPTLVSPDTFSRNLHGQLVRQSPVSAADEQQMPGSDVLVVLWSRRTSARWNQVLVDLASTLADDLGRPDLAIAWVHALLDQEQDIGLLGLRAAANCIAELAGTPLNIQNLTHDTARRLVQKLREAQAQHNTTSVEAIQLACAAVAEHDSGRDALMAALIPLLDHPEEQTLAMLTLGKIGRVVLSAEGQLRQRLYDRDLVRRLTAARLITVLGPDAAAFLPDVRNRVQHDPDPAMRAAAALAVGAMGAAGGEPALQALLHLLEAETDHWDVREAALRAIGRMGSVATRAAPQVAAYRVGSPVFVMRAAYEALGLLGAAGASVLPYLSGKGPLSVYAIGLMGARGAPALPTLLAHLSSNDLELRLAVTEAIGKLVNAGVPALDGLVRLLDDHDARIRANAAHAIGLLGLLAATAVPALAQRLRDPVEAVRMRAADALGALGSEGVDVLPVLHKSLHDRSPEIRGAAVRTVSSMGVAGRSVAQLVATLVADASDEVQLAAAEALCSIGSSVFAGSLGDLDKPRVDVRIAAAQMLSCMGALGESAERQLVEIACDPEEVLQVRLHCAQTLVTRDSLPPDLLSDLCGLLAEPQPEVWEVTAHVIKQMGAAASIIPDLQRWLASPDVQVKLAALRALAVLGPVASVCTPTVLPYLKHALPQLRQAATSAIGAIARIETAQRDHQSSPEPQGELRAETYTTQVSENVEEEEALILNALLARLADSDPLVQGAAASVLHRWGTAAGQAVPRLASRVRDSSIPVPVRAQAARALGTIGLAALPALQELMRSCVEMDLSVAIALAHALATLAPADAMLTALMRHSDDDEWQSRTLALEVMAACGGEGEEAFGAAVRALDAPYPLVRASGAHVLGMMGERASQALRRLEAACMDPDAAVRVASIVALSLVTESQRRVRIAVPLQQALVDENLEVRAAAVAAIMRVAPSAPAALVDETCLALAIGRPQGLFAAFAHRHELAIYEALGEAGSAFGERVLHLFGEKQHWSVRQRAARALGSVRYVSDEALRALERAYHASPEDRSLAVYQAVDSALEAILGLDPDVPGSDALSA